MSTRTQCGLLGWALVLFSAVILADRSGVGADIAGSGKCAKASCHPIQPHELARLREKGLKEPIRDLIADLQRRADIIPHKGTLGGKMGFYFSDRIHVLNSRWVYAYFEDGHVPGYALLSYEIRKDGKIHWRVVESFVEK